MQTWSRTILLAWTLGFFVTAMQPVNGMFTWTKRIRFHSTIPVGSEIKKSGFGSVSGNSEVISSDTEPETSGKQSVSPTGKWACGKTFGEANGLKRAVRRVRPQSLTGSCIHRKLYIRFHALRIGEPIPFV